jgi:rsbT co-antagonist protein RsbR
VVDTATADHLVRIMNAVGILGANGIIAGAQPAVASAVSALGVDLSGIETVRDVQAALKHCMKQERVKRAAASTRSATPASGASSTLTRRDAQPA